MGNASAGTLSMIVDVVRDNPIPIAITVVLLIAGAFWLACRGDAAPPPAPTAKPTGDSKRSKASDSKKESDTNESDAGEKRSEKEENSEKDDKPKEEAAGGVGLDENDD